jgi:hypothetical protein
LAQKEEEEKKKKKKKKERKKEKLHEPSPFNFLRKISIIQL